MSTRLLAEYGCDGIQSKALSKGGVSPADRQNFKNSFSPFLTLGEIGTGLHAGVFKAPIHGTPFLEWAPKRSDTALASSAPRILLIESALIDHFG